MVVLRVAGASLAVFGQLVALAILFETIWYVPIRGYPHIHEWHSVLLSISAYVFCVGGGLALAFLSRLSLPLFVVGSAPHLINQYFWYNFVDGGHRAKLAVDFVSDLGVLFHLVFVVLAAACWARLSWPKWMVSALGGADAKAPN